MIGFCLGNDRCTELDIRYANHQPLRLLRCQVVQSTHHFFSAFSTDLYYGEILLFCGLFGEAPFILEPRFFGLFDDETDLYSLGLETGGIEEQRYSKQCAAAQEGIEFKHSVYFCLGLMGDRRKNLDVPVVEFAQFFARLLMRRIERLSRRRFRNWSYSWANLASRGSRAPVR